MSGRKLRWLGLGLVATVGAGVMALTAMMNSAFAFGDTADVTAPTEPITIGLVMGPSGLPLPEAAVPGYVETADQLYIHSNFPETTYPPPYANGLSLPNYPLLSMPFSINYPDATTGPLAGFPALNTSIGQGMLILENAITSNEPNTSTVFGWSQSATIAGLEMQQLPSGTPVQFVLIGDPSAPNGGLLERFDGLNLPSLGLSFDGPTPSDLYSTDIYTLEYDGFADFPQYPINFLSDLNALLGSLTIHGDYLNPGLTAEQIASLPPLQGSAVLDPLNGLTNYYMIDQTPPLVSLLAGLPVIGTPLADLLGPDLTVLINLGYGPGNLGYSLPANAPTEFGLFPDVSPITVFDELAAGAQQGVSAFVSDLSHLSLSSLVPAATSSLPSLTDLFTGLSAAASDPSLTLSGIVDAITKTVANVNTLAFQTVDIGDAVLTSLPSYDVTLFLNNLSNPVDAVGLPIAADTGLLTLTGGFEAELVVEAITAIIGNFTALIP